MDKTLIKLALLLLRLAMSEELRSAMPLIARRLQEELPFWRRQGLTQIALEKRLAQLTSDALERSPRPHELLLVRLFTDPLGTALTDRKRLG